MVPMRLSARFFSISWRDLAIAVGPIVLLTVLVTWTAYHYVRPAPPDTITITTGTEGSMFRTTAERYKVILARNGVKLQILASEGSLQNLQRLNDPSSKVRRFASQAAGGYSEIKETVPLLERRLRKETNEGVKRSLEFDLPLLRDGYRTEKHCDGTYSLSVRTKKGIACAELTKKDLVPKRLKQIIEKIRSGEIHTSGIIEYDSGIET